MSAARKRRKAMLGSRLEPVVKSTTRVPYDTSTAKNGIVHFTDENDKVVLSLWVDAEPDKKGGIRPVIHTQSDTHLIHLTAQNHEPAEEAS